MHGQLKKRILVVDDDVSVRDSLKKLLEETGYAVLLCADGQEGAETLVQNKVELIVLDLDLPKLTGFDLIDLAMARASSTPIIILTGVADQCLPEALAGADALMEKPPDVCLLLQTIQSLLAEVPADRLRRRCLVSHSGRSRLFVAGSFPRFLEGPRQVLRGGSV